MASSDKKSTIAKCDFCKRPRNERKNSCSSGAEVRPRRRPSARTMDRWYEVVYLRRDSRGVAGRDPKGDKMKTYDGWIDVFSSGHVHVRGDAPMLEGTIPCYDAGSKKAAEELIVFACVLTRNGEGYAVPGFSVGEIRSIEAAEARFKRCSTIMRERLGS